MTGPEHGVEYVPIPDQLDLFPEPDLQLPGTPLVLQPPAETSADRRRTARQHTLVELGWHPLTRGRAYPEAGTCGDCPHRQSAGRSYPKCDLGPATKGPGTDVRAWWPACHRHPGVTGAAPTEETA